MTSGHFAFSSLSSNSANAVIRLGYLLFFVIQKGFRTAPDGYRLVGGQGEIRDRIIWEGYASTCQQILSRLRCRRSARRHGRLHHLNSAVTLTTRAVLLHFIVFIGLSD